MSDSLWTRLRRFLGGGAPPPPPPRPSRASQAPPPGLQHMANLDAPPAPTMKWQKERAGPRLKAGAWGRKISTRQRVLTVLGVISLLAMGVTAVSSMFVDRRLPTAVQGLWRSDSPAYAGRLLELRAKRISVLAGDSIKTVTTNLIDRVRQERAPDGTLYRVEYVQSGRKVEFSFVYEIGPDAIRLAHQRQVLWRRDPSNRSLLPEY